MYVKDHYRWTQVKKVVSVTLVIIGVLMSFGMEDDGSLWWGISGIAIAFTGLLIFETIDSRYW